MKNAPHTLLITIITILAMLFPALPASAQPAAMPAAVAFAAPAAPQAGETCTVLQPTPTTGLDSYIKQEMQDERRGTDIELKVKTESGKLMRSLLRFDLSSLPTDAIVSSATLSLWVKEVRDGNATIRAHQVTASWNEAEVTWKARDKAANLLWAGLGGDYNAAVLSSHNVVKDVKNYWATWNVTSATTGWISAPATNFGLILESPVTSPKNETKFKSSDDGTTSQRPKLEVCFSAGLTLAPSNTGEALAGLTKTYAHVVTVGNLTTAVNLSAASNRGWATRIYQDVNGNGLKDPADTQITQTPVIGPSASYPILVQVDVPVGVPLGMLDTTTVTATGGGKSAIATDTTRVGQLLAVQPNYTRSAVPGGVQFFGHVVFNNGSTQDCVTVNATSTAGWTVLLWEDLNRNGVHETSSPNEPAVSNPVCIDPGKAYYLVAEVRTPAGATAGTVDQTVIRAASAAVPGKVGAATDTTTVIANTPPVVDGKYDTIYNVSPDAQVVCYNDTAGTLFGKLATFYQPSGDGVYMTLAIDKNFVDNTYGANIINWPRTHNFSDLVGSDKAQFWGYNAAGTKVLDFDVDYVSTKSGTPSGYASLGVSGGDGGMNTGSAAHILQASTSLSNSLNAYGYCVGGVCSGLGTNLLLNSPASDAFYTPNPTYPNWDFNVIYEVKISPAAFGVSGFGAMDIPYIHASPSKLGTNTIYAEPGVCPGEIGDTVWHDRDHDGVQDAGELGLAGVQVKLYRDDGDLIFDSAKDTVVGTQTTSASGKYLFQNVTPGDYFAIVVESTVPVGYIITTNNSPTSVFNLPEGGSYLDADFGYAQPWGDYQISKTLTSGNPSVVGEEIAYTIRITNTGATFINFLPLQDLYDPAKQQFVGATPAPNSTSSGVIEWSDLTASFGRDLGLGQAFEVQLRFLALGATQPALASARQMASAVTVAPMAAFPPVVPSVAQIAKYLVVSMGDDADVGRAFQMSNSEIGADRRVLSVAQDPGYITDGGFPNLLDVFSSRWNVTTDPDSISGAAPVFAGIDWTGEVALTSDNGKFDSSNSLVFADLGIQTMHSSPLASVSNSYFYDLGVTGPAGPMLAIGSGVTTGNNFAPLLSELTAWRTYILSLTADATIANNAAFQNNRAANGIGGLRTTYTDVNGDGIAVVDVDPGGDFDLANLDWVISSANNVPVIFRLRNGRNMVVNNVSILMGSSGLTDSDLGAIFVSAYEGSGSGDTVFNVGSNLILNGIGFWDLNAIGEGGSTKTNININNAQGCAQFISQKVNFQNNRWNRCVPFVDSPAAVTIDVEKEV